MTQAENPHTSPEVIEMPAHLQAQVNEALAREQIEAGRVQAKRDAATMAVAHSINDSRPEGVSPTLPEPGHRHEEGFLGASNAHFARSSR